jgi:hypothetical protein
MNNECMVKAHDGLTVLGNVDAETFIGFCEFAYIGHYRSRMAQLGPDTASSSAAVMKEEDTRDATVEIWPPAAEEDVWRFGKSRKNKDKKTGQTMQISQLWTDFLKLTYEKAPTLTRNENPKLLNGDQYSAPTITT